MTEPTSYRVNFECGHATWILPDEYGDGSAYCLDCEDFQEYDVALATATQQRRRRSRMTGSLVLSWGANGGLYVFRRRTCLRVCLWRVALTWYAYENEDVLRAGLDALDADEASA